MDDRIEQNGERETEQDSDAMHILERLEGGQIDVDQAARMLTGEDRPVEEEAPIETEAPYRTRAWWLIPFGIGLAMTGMGAGIATLSGWWWLCAGPLLLIGVTLLIIGVVSISSPWIHIRVDTGQDEWPRRIVISLPLPLRFSGWVLRQFGHWIPGLGATGVDELLLALDTFEGGFSPESPLFIEVEDGEDGERVEVYLG
jgi:hypothetical protein